MTPPFSVCCVAQIRSEHGCQLDDDERGAEGDQRARGRRREGDARSGIGTHPTEQQLPEISRGSPPRAAETQATWRLTPNLPSCAQVLEKEVATEKTNGEKEVAPKEVGTEKADAEKTEKANAEKTEKADAEKTDDAPTGEEAAAPAEGKDTTAEERKDAKADEKAEAPAEDMNVEKPADDKVRRPCVRGGGRDPARRARARARPRAARAPASAPAPLVVGCGAREGGGRPEAQGGRRDEARRRGRAGPRRGQGGRQGGGRPEAQGRRARRRGARREEADAAQERAGAHRHDLDQPHRAVHGSLRGRAPALPAAAGGHGDARGQEEVRPPRSDEPPYGCRSHLDTTRCIGHGALRASTCAWTREWTPHV